MRIPSVVLAVGGAASTQHADTIRPFPGAAPRDFSAVSVIAATRDPSLPVGTVREIFCVLVDSTRDKEALVRAGCLLGLGGSTAGADW